MRLPLLLAALVVSLAAPGSTPAQDRPEFRSESNLVVLHVNVFDRHLDPVTTLTPDSFVLVEDDKPQKISFFSSEDVPVTVGLVLDNSSSMIARHGMVVAGGMAFANSSHPEDELFTVGFTENVRLGLPQSVQFTSSRPLLLGTLNAMKAGGKTAMHDAVIRALEHIRDARHQKRVLIVLSDGDDTASAHTKQEMFELARSSDVIIYAICIGGLMKTGDSDPGTMRELARIGGGVAYFPENEQSVIQDFERIARNIRQGYNIGYVPTNTARDNSFRRVTIKVQVPGRDLDARYRHGYKAADSSRAQ